MWAQSSVLSIAPLPKLSAKRNTTVDAKVPVLLQPGYHANSHTPSESYLIPLRLTWEPGPLEAVDVVYPKPQMEKYEFADKPLSVYTGNFEIVTKFKVGASAPDGPNLAVGKLRYQACTHNLCLPPKTVEVKLPLVIQ